ncbi:hypothetical protein V6N13_024874 [Hibiscus sabdariffa]|uniref:Uncharacterized protein n=1 Tax=Hibiscus sabdariffa TaxID=183260 RepID=A0ABR2QGJ1_9ROSI
MALALPRCSPRRRARHHRSYSPSQSQRLVPLFICYSLTFCSSLWPIAQLLLFKILGVEPRNLRKLVENGIQGVAELKQLYKEKLLTMEKDVDEVGKFSRFIKGQIEELDREPIGRSLDAEKEQV